jgi:heme exporter protein CcmD
MDGLAMGGYGAYVWSCYSLTLVIVLFSYLKALEDRE